jgi:hypothetical protein
VNRPDEPPDQRWVNGPAARDDGDVTHLLNVLSGSVLIYAGVTRGSLLVSRALMRITR